MSILTYVSLDFIGLIILGLVTLAIIKYSHDLFISFNEKRILLLLNISNIEYDINISPEIIYNKHKANNTVPVHRVKYSTFLRNFNNIRNYNYIYIDGIKKCFLKYNNSFDYKPEITYVLFDSEIVSLKEEKEMLKQKILNL